eukprot:TRINITY_DN7790_c1_g2_i3.p2 TRINITY_DN7790_c1_g2~~TRINITY_DN7790_c1_g2_i3.p2  ORF type:complete len:424 (-),score=34.11 TRINITY_DN7790_c1_g2_i3:1838-3109(-)
MSKSAKSYVILRLLMSVRPNLLYSTVLLFSLFIASWVLLYHFSYAPPPVISSAPFISFHQLYLEKYPQQKSSKNITKIAYFLSVNQNQISDASRLMDRILDAFNYYTIHLDLGMTPKEFEWGMWLFQQHNQTHSNIWLLERYLTTSGGISEVDVEIMGMAFILEKFQDWQFFVNLYPEHYPLVPQQAIREVLEKVPAGVSFVKGQPDECSDVDQMVGTIRYDKALGGEQNGLMKKTYQRSRVEQDFALYRGSKQHILSRQLVKYLVYSTDGYARRLLLYCANLLQPMEFYYSTLVCNHPEYSNLVVNEDWIFTQSNDQKIQQSIDEKVVELINSSNFFIDMSSNVKGEEIMNRIDQFILNGNLNYTGSLSMLQGKEKPTGVSLQNLKSQINLKLDQIFLEKQMCEPIDDEQQRTGKFCEIEIT